MAYFAREIDYCACECEFVALIEIAVKKGGRPIKFVLYRYNSYFGAEMVDFGPESKKEAKKSFPYGPVIYEDEPENERMEGLPRPMKNPWQKTTKWLYKVGAGGGYKIYPKGTWVKVGHPAPWKKRRRKLHLRIGELGHIFLLKKKGIKELINDECDIRQKLEWLKYDYDDESNEPYEKEYLTQSEIDEIKKLGEELLEIKTAIMKEESDINNLRSEMRFRRDKNRCVL